MHLLAFTLKRPQNTKNEHWITFPGRFEMKYDKQTDRHKQLCCFTHFPAGKVTFPGRFEMKYDKQTDRHKWFCCFTHFFCLEKSLFQANPR